MYTVVLKRVLVNFRKVSFKFCMSGNSLFYYYKQSISYDREKLKKGNFYVTTWLNFMGPVTIMGDHAIITK